MAEDTGFTLDNRTIEWHLDNFLHYSATIPFGDDASCNWREVFKRGVSKEELVRLYHDTTQAGGDLAPLQAFLLVFFHLLETPRRLINDVPGMHRQFYYRDLLKMHERAARPDRTVVGIQLDEGASDTLIPAGTLMNGGQSLAGEPLLYATTQDLLASHGQIAWCGEYRPEWREGKKPQIRTLYSHEQGQWPEHGITLFSHEDAPTEPVCGGCAVVSAALRGETGRREISVTFDAESAVFAAEALLADISSEEGWLPLEAVVKKDAATFVLSEAAPAITAPGGLDRYVDAQPVLRIRRPGGKALRAVNVVMTMHGATHIAMSTDDGLASPQESCYPFGAQAGTGRGINLMAPEWAAPEAIAVTLVITPRWLDLPETSFSEWYTGYTPTVTNDNDFTVRVMEMTRDTAEESGNGTRLLQSSVALFVDNNTKGTAPQGNVLKVKDVAFDVVPPPARNRDNPQSWARWLRLELTPRDGPDRR